MEIQQAQGPGPMLEFLKSIFTETFGEKIGVYFYTNCFFNYAWIFKHFSQKDMMK
jgi:hypothetical protein